MEEKRSACLFLPRPVCEPHAGAGHIPPPEAHLVLGATCSPPGLSPGTAVTVPA